MRSCFFVCCSVDLFAWSTRLVKRPVGCSSVVWLWLLMHVFQWRPPCTAPVSTAPIRPLRLQRLSCAWIHLPVSEKIGAQVRPPSLRARQLSFSKNWHRLRINHLLSLCAFRRVYPSLRSNPRLPSCRHASWHDLRDRGGNIDRRLLRGRRRGHERPHGRTGARLRASQEEERSVVESETCFSRPVLKTRTFKC